MKYVYITCVISIFSLGIVPVASFSNDLTFIGTSGVLVTPDARLLKKGKISYQYNNYIENHLERNYKDHFNHLFSIGVSDYLELGGRLTNYTPIGISHNPNGTKRGKRDLSANLKIKVPMFTSWMPNIAVGFNDFAGQAVNFKSQYIVATQSFKDIIDADFSVGYATGDNLDFNGKFVNLRYNVLPELSLLAEHDKNNTRIGFSYDFSKYLKLPLSLKAGTPVTGDGSTIIGLSFQLALDQKSSKFKNIKNNKEIIRKLEGTEKERITRLMNSLAQYGLEDLKAGRNKAGQYVIFAENRIYNHSTMDAISIILGTAHEYLKNNDSLKLILTRQGRPELVVNTGIQALATYLSDGSSRSKNIFNQQLSVSLSSFNTNNHKNIKWFNNFSNGNSPRLDIQLRPIMATSVGHEWGSIDYSLGLATSLKVGLWKGGNILLSGVTPLHSTENFNDHGVFNKQKIKSGLREVILQQHYKPTKNLSILGSVGKVKINRNDYSMVQTEARWISDYGQHQFSTNLARYKEKNKSNDDRTLATVSYEHFIGDFDRSYEVSYGKYFEGDKGLKLKLKQRFGDTTLSAFVNYIDKSNSSGGLALSFPLTPRKDYKNSYVLVRGTPAWYYQQATTIRDPLVVGSNRLRPNMMSEPKLSNSLSKDYLDSNRLTPGYIKAHIERLREAYFTLSK